MLESVEPDGYYQHVRPIDCIVDARNLAPLPGDVDFTIGASLPISGLTAWQGLFEHGRLQAGQSVLAHGAAGAGGTMVTQLAREVSALD